ncbi:MAG TPA: NTP transferase domain-containing protein [Nitrososphaerales archaeon]|nr:NTP transferase domain-containing protein [Nitrososphaerales archaeon]
MPAGNTRGAIIFATGMEGNTISRQFESKESGTLLEYVLDSVWTVADELIVVFGREPDLSLVEAIAPFGAKVLSCRKGESPMTALFDSFETSKSELCLLTTERVPLLKPNVALALYEAAQGYDLAIPKWKDGRLEPFLSVYRRKAFVRASKSRTKSSDDVRSELAALVEGLFAIKYVSVEKELQELDPELDSFLEVKDEKTLQAARSKASIKARKILKRGSL